MIARTVSFLSSKQNPGPAPKYSTESFGKAFSSIPEAFPSRSYI